MQFFGKSDVGMKRYINQDSFVCRSIWGGDAVLLVVCDGMGGHKAGEIASQKAATVFCDRIFKSPCFEEDPNRQYEQIKRIMVSAANEANRVVYTLSKTHEELSGMGTTLVAAIIQKGYIFVINVGDSRAYIINRREALQVTRDHSFVQYLLSEKKITEEEAKNYPHKNIITRAIGINETVSVDISRGSLSKWGTGYVLLCSDGLSNYCTNDDLVKIVATHTAFDRENPERELARKSEELINHANSLGGSDNITAVLAKF